MAQKNVSLWVVRLVAVFYIVIGLYQLWFGAQTEAYAAVLFGVVGVPGGMGVLLNRPWAAHFILAASLPVVVWWSWRVVRFFWVDGPAESLSLTFFMLLPGLLLMTGMIASPYLIYRYFSGLRSEA